jgi:hypothetical protein
MRVGRRALSSPADRIGGCRVRDVLALLLGLAISLLGFLVVLATMLDLPGVLLIAAGMAVAWLHRTTNAPMRV